jgi:hypothetical protein
MSTTADKSVAMSYANGRGIVAEISVGRIQLGGDVSFLSMVPRPPPLNPRFCSRPACAVPAPRRAWWASTHPPAIMKRS